MTKKQRKQLEDYIHDHLIQAIDLIVQIHMTAKKHSLSDVQKLRIIRAKINSYRIKQKGKIEF